jgi:hypothetical protein
MKPKDRQDWIFKELVKDKNKTFGEMFSDYLVTFGKLSEVTFTIDWKKANTTHLEYRDGIKNKVIEASAKEEIKAVKKAILSKHEAMEILTEIAIGKPKKVEGTIVMPTASERRGAIETMAKIEGWNAPAKSENLNTNLNQEVTVIKWGNNEVQV